MSVIQYQPCTAVHMHTNFTALCVTEAEFWSTSSMLEEAVYELERIVSLCIKIAF